jgi:hypothetical protein
MRWCRWRVTDWVVVVHAGVRSWSSKPITASEDLARGTKVREYVLVIYSSHAMLHVPLPMACRPARQDRHEGSSASAVMRPDLA